MPHYSMLLVGVGAQFASHYYRKYYWRLDNPDANPYLYVHDLPKPTFSEIPSNAISITPPAASATPVLASPAPNGFLPNSVISWFITIFFVLCLQSIFTLAFYKIYQHLTAPEIPAGHVVLPANHQIASKAQLDRLKDEVVEAKMTVRHAVGSVKGYSKISKLWEGGFMTMSKDFMDYVQKRTRSDWVSEADILEFRSDTSDRIGKLNEEWRGTCSSLTKDFETWRVAAEERIAELEAQLVEQRLHYETVLEKMRLPRENKSVRKRKAAERAAAAAAAPVGSSQASTSSS